MKKFLLVSIIAIMMVTLMVGTALAAWDYKVTGGAYVDTYGNGPHFTINLAAMANGDGTSDAKGKVEFYQENGNWFVGEITGVMLNATDGSLASILATSTVDGDTWPYMRVRLYDDGEGNGAVDHVNVNAGSSPFGFALESWSATAASGTLISGNIQVH